MLIAILKWTAQLILLLGVLLGMSACTMLGLNYASLAVDNKPEITPPLSLPLQGEAIQNTLETELYGPWPEDLALSAGELRMIDANYLDGRGTLQEIPITLGTGEGARTFPVIVAIPNSAAHQPVPLLISQTFAGNCSVFPNDPVSNGAGGICEGSEMTGVVGFLGTNIFGTYIAYAPVERYFEAGLAYASFTGPNFIPDSRSAAERVRAQLSEQTAQSGTLILWAKAYAAAAEVLAEDPRISGHSIAAMGHSRYGKSALLAAAYAPQIAAAIAHQSGFAGGSSSRSETGETLQRMASSYPHWLRPGLAEDLKSGFELSLDQHYLLALSAPKPLFLGNGRRDVWSDPNSSYRIAQAANAAYLDMGVEGLAQSDMLDFNAGAELAYWLRTGGHSVVSEDIDAFIAFMQAHFSD